MKITRYFTREGQSPYADIPFRPARPGREAAALLPPGALLQVPAAYSQAAVDFLAQTACRKSGVPAKLKKIAEDGVPEWLQRAEPDERAQADLEESARFGAETDAGRIFSRMSGAWTYSGWKNGYFNSEKDARAFYDELCCMLARQCAAPNAAQWRNAGLYWAYGIASPAAAGVCRLDPQTGEAVPAAAGGFMPFAHIIRAAAAEEDGAADAGAAPGLWQACARAARLGAATGSNISAFSRQTDIAALLKAGEALLQPPQNGGAGAAMMAALNAGCADIEAYIDAGAEAETDAAALRAGRTLLEKRGKAIIHACRPPRPAPNNAKTQDNAAAEADTGQDLNPALKAAVAAAQKDGVPDSYIQRLIRAGINGQQFAPAQNEDNPAAAEAGRQNSVLRRALVLPGAFLRAVEENGDWRLAPRRCQNGAGAQTGKTVKARRLWDKIACAAWAGSAPALHFSETINAWHNAPAAGPIQASSADCAFLFADETACASVSLNLSAFSGDKNHFDGNAFIHAVRLWLIMSDILPFAARFPNAETARRARDYRPAALGCLNLAALLMAMGIAYDSEEGRAFCAAATALMSGAAYLASAELAAEFGTFSGYAGNAAAMLRSVRNRRRAAYGQTHGYEGLNIPPAPLKAAKCPNADLVRLARAAWDKALRLGETYGFRNAQLSALSADPAAATLDYGGEGGLAPEESLVKFKKRADGSCFKIISRAVPQALRSLGYTAAQTADISAYLVGAADLRNAPDINSAALRAKGFDDSALKRIEAALPNAACLRAVFTPALAGEAFCQNKLGLSAETMSQPGFDLLAALGFSPRQIARAERFLCGAADLSGAPHLLPEHHPVFACAAEGGRGAVSWPSQIRMAAAAQAFLCGGVSLPLALPAEASAEDCAKAAMMAWKLGLKTINVSRRRENLPLGLNTAAIFAGEAELAAKNSRTEAEIRLKRAGGKCDILPKTERQKLPNRRRGYTQKAVINGHTIYLHTSEFEDGRPGEIFIEMPKESAAFRAMMNNFAASVSLGLQYGVPLEAFVKAFAFSKFEPAGSVRGSETIKNADSVLDYIFRELAVFYLDRYDLAHIRIADSPEAALAEETEQTPRFVPLGWRDNSGFKSNIAARLLPSADKKGAAAAEGGQPDNGETKIPAETNAEDSGSAPANLIVPQFSRSAARGAAAEGGLNAPSGADGRNAAAVFTPLPDNTAETIGEKTAFAAAGAPGRAAMTSGAENSAAAAPAPADKEPQAAPAYSPLIMPFSNPDSFAAQPAPAAEQPQPAAETETAEGLAAEAETAAAKPGEENLDDVLERSLIREFFGAAAAKTAAPEAGGAQREPNRKNDAGQKAEQNAAQSGGETSPKPHRTVIEPARTQTALSGQARQEETLPQKENRPAAGQIPANESAPYRARPASGYSSDMCPECHNFTMLRSGAVLKCDICGAVLTPERGESP